MANPQPIPFVQFSKELYDAILRSPMPATQKGVVLAIVRRTYGDGGRRQAEIAVGMLSRMLGQNKGTVSRALSDLIDRGVVKVIRDYERSHSTTRVLSLNKNYEAWGGYSVSPAEVAERVADEQPSEPVQPLPTSNPRVADEQPLGLPVGNSTVAVQQLNGCSQATIEDKRQEQEQELKRLPPKRPVVSAPDEVDWQSRAAALLEASHFPSDLMQLGELLAAKNKTGKAQLSRIVRELYEPIVALQDELPDAAIHHGLRAAIAKPAPNANYVKAAARGYSGNGSTPAANSYQDELTDEDRDFYTHTWRDEPTEVTHE